MRSRLPPWAVAGLFPWLLAGNATVAAWAQSPSGTLTATPNPCAILAGKTACTSTLAWTSNAPIALATVDVRGGRVVAKNDARFDITTSCAAIR